MLICKFSGGRSSGYATWTLIRQGKKIDYVIFNNTGIESEQTYEFIRFFKERVLDPEGIPLIVLEYAADNWGPERMWRGKMLPVRETNIYDCYKLHCALDEGENSPFFQYLRYNKLIPDTSSRTCTMRLKVETTSRWLESKGIEDPIYAIGFRAEEQRRVARYKAKDPDAIFPLVEMGCDREEVLKFWEEKAREWDMPIKAGDEETRLSNCTGCFYSNLKAKLDVCIQSPKIADLWARMEEWFYVYRTTKFPEKYAVEKTGNSAAKIVAWTRKYLQRDPTKKELCMRYFNSDHGWHMLIELAKKVGKGSDLPLFMIPIMSDKADHGGCDSGVCRMDV